MDEFGFNKLNFSVNELEPDIMRKGYKDLGNLLLLVELLPKMRSSYYNKFDILFLLQKNVNKKRYVGIICIKWRNHFWLVFFAMLELNQF